MPLRILVQSDMIGAIIGKSGTTIKQITQQSKARIDVHREDCLDHSDKVITIEGPPENCSQACYKILKVIDNEKLQQITNNNNKDTYINNNNNSHDSASEELDQRAINNNNQNNDNLDNPSIETSLKILAHNNLIGRLIGKSGNSIKSIMEQTSTKINISVNGLTDSTQERTITVVGELEQVARAEQIISTKLRAAYSSDMNLSMQNVGQNNYLFNNLPISYMPRPYAQNQIPNTVNSQQGHTAPPVMSRTIGSHQNSITPHSIFSNSNNYLPLYQNLGVQPTGPGYLNLNHALHSVESERETVHMYVPANMVGAIIGKSGVAIKEMISNSGASIKIAAAAPVSDVSSQSNNSTDIERKQAVSSSGSSPAPTRSRGDDKQLNPVQGRKHQNESDSSKAINSKNANDVHESTDQSQEQDQTIRNNHNNINNPQSGPAATVRPDPSSLRKVTIVGTPESQYYAQYLVYRKISSENSRSDVSLLVEVQIPSQLVGKIIGKGGSSVKLLQRQSQTTIRLFDDKPVVGSESEVNTSAASSLSNEPTTTVQITGEFKNSQMVQSYIRNLIQLHNSYNQGHNQQQVHQQQPGQSQQPQSNNNHHQASLQHPSNQHHHHHHPNRGNLSAR